jgi:hypothetical protein
MRGDRAAAAHTSLPGHMRLRADALRTGELQRWVAPDVARFGKAATLRCRCRRGPAEPATIRDEPLALIRAMRARDRRVPSPVVRGVVRTGARAKSPDERLAGRGSRRGGVE